MVDKTTAEKLTKADCGKEMTQKESREVQVNMLDALSHFCGEQSLRYFLSGGTLLGAVRHKGFIPWDDDIDVNMPRPDCEKLFALTGGKLGPYEIVQPFRDAFNPSCEFYRIYDHDTVLENIYVKSAKKHPFYQPVFIDIFPIDGLPDGERETKKLYRKIFLLRKLFTASTIKHLDGRNLLVILFYLLMRFPARIIGAARWERWLDETQRAYAFDAQRYIGVTSSGAHAAEEKVLKQDYMQEIEVEFEGKKYRAPQNYAQYLTQLYGSDYMQLPPEEARKTHHGFKMYWRKK